MVMSREFIIADNVMRYANGRNPLDERLLYGGESHWSRKLALAKKYPDAEAAIVDAKVLHAEVPVKIFMLEAMPNGFNLAEVQVQL
jgi:hypothetical protein